jgi:WD40 repeat protein
LIQLHDGRIASGSSDKTIRIWNVDGTSIEWNGHTDWVYCLLQLQDGRIVSGSVDRTIRIWNMDGTSIEWKGHKGSARSLIQLQDGRIVSTSYDGTIRIWNDDGSSTIVCKGDSIIPIYTKEDLQQGRYLLYELLKDYIVEDVKSIVYQYVKPW